LDLVGYGDVSPDTWLSRLCVIVLIIMGFCVLPKKIESLTQTWMELERAGYDNTSGFSSVSKHIVVTIPHLDCNFVHDFLTEFYAHRKHQAYMVVLLAPCDLDVGMRNLLRIPVWSDRVLFIRGTALRDDDLDRVHMTSARACFILSARNVQQKKESVSLKNVYCFNSSIRLRTNKLFYVLGQSKTMHPKSRNMCRSAFIHVFIN
jgi:hypothetical protein